MKIIIDFSHFQKMEDMYDFLYEKVGFTTLYDRPVGRSADGFFDMFNFSDDEDFFEIHGYNTIKDLEYQRKIKAFISSLEGLKGYQDEDKRIVPNPNFDYKIVS